MDKFAEGSLLAVNDLKLISSGITDGGNTNHRNKKLIKCLKLNIVWTLAGANYN